MIFVVVCFGLVIIFGQLARLTDTCFRIGPQMNLFSNNIVWDFGISIILMTFHIDSLIYECHGRIAQVA